MGSAVISECGKWRYTLTRRIPSILRWVKPCLFVMLNPSTADAEKDDPTIRRCIGFAKSWGCTDLTVVNLFAFRATDPKQLDALDWPTKVGPDNDRHIAEQIAKHAYGTIVAAWGASKVAHARAIEVRSMLAGRASCLGKTKAGAPKHPLYVPAAAELVQL